MGEWNRDGRRRRCSDEIFTSDAGVKALWCCFWCLVYIKQKVKFNVISTWATNNRNEVKIWLFSWLSRWLRNPRIMFYYMPGAVKYSWESYWRYPASWILHHESELGDTPWQLGDLIFATNKWNKKIQCWQLLSRMLQRDGMFVFSSLHP